MAYVEFNGDLDKPQSKPAFVPFDGKLDDQTPGASFAPFNGKLDSTEGIGTTALEAVKSTGSAIIDGAKSAAVSLLNPVGAAYDLYKAASTPDQPVSVMDKPYVDVGAENRGTSNPALGPLRKDYVDSVKAQPIPDQVKAAQDNPQAAKVAQDSIAQSDQQAGLPYSTTDDDVDRRASSILKNGVTPDNGSPHLLSKNEIDFLRSQPYTIDETNKLTSGSKVNDAVNHSIMNTASAMEKIAGYAVQGMKWDANRLGANFDQSNWLWDQARKNSDMAERLTPASDASIAEKVGFGVAAFLPDLLLMGSSGQAVKLGEPIKYGWSAITSQLGHGAQTMQVIAVKNATNVASDVLAKGGTQEDAIKAATVSGLFDLTTGGVAMGANGPIVTRVVTGIPTGAAINESRRRAMNAVLPANQQQHFTVEDALVGGLTQGVLHGAMGSNAQHQPVQDRADLGYLPGQRPMVEAVRSTLSEAHDNPVAAKVDPILAAPDVDTAIAQAKATLSPVPADVKTAPTDIASLLESIRPIQRTPAEAPKPEQPAIAPEVSARITTLEKLRDQTPNQDAKIALQGRIDALRPKAEEPTPEASTDRRQDTALRQRVADMTPEEMQKSLLTSHLMDLPNGRAFQERVADHPEEHVLSADLDDFKALNDKHSHPGADDILRSIGDIKREVAEQFGVNPFHRSGDEFLATHSDPAILESYGKALQDKLADTTFEVRQPDGTITTQKGVGFSYGTGRNEVNAEARAVAQKSERQRLGLRTGQRPAVQSLESRRETGQSDQSGRNGAPDQVKGQQALFSRNRVDSNDHLINIYSEVAKHDEAFGLPHSESKSLAGVVEKVAPKTEFEDITPHVDVGEYAGNEAWKNVNRVSEIRSAGDPTKAAMVFETTDGRVWLDISKSDTGGGGNAIYQAVATYAHNTGKKFVGDPMGLSQEAAYRRLEQMISSTLRHGTTEHLEPHERQTNPDPVLGDKIRQLNWSTNDHAKNLREMLEASHYNVSKAIPEINDVHYNFARGRFETAPDSAARRLVDEHISRAGADVPLSKVRDHAADEKEPVGSHGDEQERTGSNAERGSSETHGENGKLLRLDSVHFTDADFHALAGAISGSRGAKVPSSRGTAADTIGLRTLKRAALTQSVLRGEGSEGGRAVLDHVSERLLQRLGPQLHDVLYSKDKTSSNTHTPESFRGSMSDALNGLRKGLSGLLDHPNVRVITDAQIPDHVIGDRYAYEIGGKAYAYVDHGTINFIADNIPKNWTPEQLAGLAKHEISVHALQLGRDSKEFKNILGSMDLMRKSGNKAIQEAYDNVPRDTPRHLVDEEALGYLVQHAPKLSIVQRFTAWLKQQIQAFGKGFSGMDRVNFMEWANRLTPEDLNYMAERALRGAIDEPAPQKGDTAMASRAADTFYSALGRSLVGMHKIADKSGMIGPEQARLWLQARQKEGKFKADELQWSGLDDYLKIQTGKVPVADIEAFVRDNGVKVTEVMKGGDAHPINKVGVRQTDSGKWEVYFIDSGKQYGEYSDSRDASAARERAADTLMQEPKYGSYVLPGGENYRELLLTLPTKPLPESDVAERHYEAFVRKGGEPSWADLNDAKRREILDSMPKAARSVSDDKTFKSSHWDEPNVLAHIRFNDRTDADGKKVLFIEELQSDWGQKGKKEGFKNQESLKDKSAELRNEASRLHESGGDPAKVKALMAESIAIDGKLRDEKPTALPNAPFVGKTDAWLSLGIKRMIRYAAESGYDKVAFVNGEQSADRYDLSKQVDSIGWYANKDDTYNISYKKDGQTQTAKNNASKSELPDLVGKELAAKIIKASDDEVTGNFSGLDLKVGGEGMKHFYDRIVPQVANDVLKKLVGGKVYGVSIPGNGEWSKRQRRDGVWRVLHNGEETGPRLESEEAANRVIERNNGGLTQAGFDITPELRDKAMSGMPLFSKAKAEPDREEQRVEATGKLPGDGMISHATGALSDLIDAGMNKGKIYDALAPMSAGTQSTRAIAQRHINLERKAQYQWTQIEKILMREFTPEQRRNMWEAADEENDLRREGIQDDTKGLGRLAPKERIEVETLHTYGEELWRRAKDSGLVSPDAQGVHYWTPRMMAKVDEAGSHSRPSEGKQASSDGVGRNITTTAGSAKHRNYETAAETEAAMQAKGGVLVRDIRTMPMAMARMEKAIAGRELINQIKELGKATGKELVLDHAEPDFFTLDHPAFTTLRPRIVDGKTVPDQDGNPIFDRVPIYISDDFKGPLKAIMTTSKHPAYTGYMLLKSKAMSAIMFSPLIHNQVILGRALAYGGIKTFSMYFTGHTAKNDTVFMQKMIEGGMVPIGAHNTMIDVGDIAEGRLGKEGGWGDPNESWIGLGAKAVGNKIHGGLGDTLKGVVDKAGDIWHNKLLWDRIGDLQAGIAKDVYTKLRAQGIDDNAAATVAAHIANRYAGAIGRENMSQLAHVVANVTLFSKSFNAGNVGTVKDAFYGLPAGLKAQLRENSSAKSAMDALQFAKHKARIGLVRDAAFAIAIASLVQDWYRRDKNADWNMDSVYKGWNQYKKRAFEMWANASENPLNLDSYNPSRISSTWNNEPDKEGRIDLGAQDTGRHEYQRLPTGKVYEDILGWTMHPGDTFDNKMSPMLKAAIGWKNGVKDKYGTPISDPNAPMLKRAAQVAEFLVGTQIPLDQLKTLKDVVTGHGTQLDKDKLRGNFTGFSVGQGHPNGPEAGVAAKAEERTTASKRFAMEEAKRSLKYGDDDGARETLANAGLTPKEINSIVRRIESPRDGMSPAQRKKFNQHANSEDQERMDRLPQ